ncbi:MAG TPA: hypothetical protein VES42_21585, partial [Pilimelia sp.]|nr:hypothetical protein [Pilimelia sp.]
CCGLPAYVVVPIFQQYPATVAVPAEVAGYQLRDDPDSTRVARELADTAGADDMFADDTFAAMYSGGPGHTVLVYGMTGLRFTPRDDLDATFSRLAPRYAVKTSEQVDAGPAGGHQRCGVGAGDGDDLVLCAWADHGSLGVATFSAGSVQRSAEVLAELRGQLLHRS